MEFVRALLVSMSTPTIVADAATYPKLKGTDLQRMRGDVRRVGKSWSKVMRGRKELRKAAA